MKNRIIEASIELFNEMGAHRVTTNHIIARLGISPGTFYYHYRNREEIIRAIFTSLTEEFAGANYTPGSGFSVDDFLDSVRGMYRLYYKYRFFYLDISMLLDRDPELEKSYRDNYRKKSAKMREVISRLEKEGILRGFPGDTERELFIENIWTITDFRLPFLKVSSEITEEKIVSDGIAGYIAFFKPYITGNISWPA